MRLLAAALLAACSGSSSSPIECEPAAPETVNAPIPSPPPIAPTERMPHELDMARRCPIGDGVNVSVYSVLVAEIAAANQEDEGRAAVRAALAREREDLKTPNDIKPRRASLVEGELSHLLADLCRTAEDCAGVGLYTRSGLAFALTGQPTAPPLGFGDDGRWAALTARAHEDGGVFEPTCDELKSSWLPCDGKHQLIAFPVFDDDALLGLAMCIVKRGPPAGT